MRKWIDGGEVLPAVCSVSCFPLRGGNWETRGRTAGTRWLPLETRRKRGARFWEARGNESGCRRNEPETGGPQGMETRGLILVRRSSLWAAGGAGGGLPAVGVREVAVGRVQKGQQSAGNLSAGGIGMEAEASGRPVSFPVTSPVTRASMFISR